MPKTSTTVTTTERWRQLGVSEVAAVSGQEAGDSDLTGQMLKNAYDRALSEANDNKRAEGHASQPVVSVDLQVVVGVEYDVTADRSSTDH